MTPLEFGLAMSVSAVASGINTVAGGGSLVSFPFLLVGLGMPPIPANVTNTASLWPGSLAGGVGFLNLIGKAQHHLRTLIAPTLVGSVIGATLLLTTSPRVFSLLVPPLILLAATLLAFQPRIKKWAAGKHRKVGRFEGFCLQFLVSVYGGYFGAGMGIMMLAAFSLYVDGDIHEHNAIKNWLGVFINFAATGVFAIQGKAIHWDIAFPMILGAVIGGYLTARVSQRFDANRLRVAIACYGFVAAGYFVYRLFTA